MISFTTCGINENKRIAVRSPHSRHTGKHCLVFCREVEAIDSDWLRLICEAVIWMSELRAKRKPLGRHYNSKLSADSVRQTRLNAIIQLRICSEQNVFYNTVCNGIDSEEKKVLKNYKFYSISIWTVNQTLRSNRSKENKKSQTIVVSLRKNKYIVRVFEGKEQYFLWQ